MFTGLGILCSQAGYEYFYWTSVKKDRDVEIKEVSNHNSNTMFQERDEEKKFAAFGEIMDDEGPVEKIIEEAQGRKSLFQMREDYKQKRLGKILEMKEKEKERMSAGEIMEEVRAKPGAKENKMKPLMQVDEKIQAERNKADTYI